MIYFVFLFILLVFLSLLVIGNKNWNKKLEESNGFRKKIYHFLYYNDELIYVIGWVGSVIIGIILAVMTMCIVTENIGADATLALKQEQYKALVYKAESDFIQDEFGFVNKEIADEIQNWNETVAYNKLKQKNVWTGIFVADIYDELELIDLSKLKK